MELRTGAINKTSVPIPTSVPMHLSKHRPQPRCPLVGAALARDLGPLIIDTDPQVPLEWRLPGTDDDELLDWPPDVAASPDAMRPNSNVDYFLDQLDRVLDED